MQLLLFGMPSSMCPLCQNCHSSLLAPWVGTKWFPIAVKWKFCSELGGCEVTLTPQFVFSVKLSFKPAGTFPHPAPAVPWGTGGTFLCSRGNISSLPSQAATATIAASTTTPRLCWLFLAGAEQDPA